LERVGGDRPITVNVRVVVATHRDLETMVRSGEFRQDLFHRIYVFPLRLPPLRERPDDIPLLADYFARQVTRMYDWKPRLFLQDAYEQLRRYSWPGNIRELRNVIERLLLLSDDEITGASVQSALGVREERTPATTFGYGPLPQRVETFERNVILNELKLRDYKMTETAKALGLERSHLYKKCQQLGIDVKSMRAQE
jgi:two-component system nitrogen regulation response regulator NtrX